MAVAVKNTPESQTRGASGSLTLASALGALYVLGALAAVFVGVPLLWQNSVATWLGPNFGFVSTFGQMVVMAFAVGALAVFGLTLAGPSPRAGLRAGVFTVLAGLAVVALLTVWVGRILERFLPAGSPTGLTLTALTGVGLLAAAWWLYSSRMTPKRLAAFDEQGWFTAARYKPSQGLRVRRATMLGLLVLFAAGIYAMINHGTLASGPGQWAVRIPFTDVAVTILPDVRFTAPLLLGAAGFWVAFRVVNLPTFADFLIATEAEVNKVSWPARRSVIQDTIVVLTTVVLMTIFLFVVDFAWGWVLSRPVVGVLRAFDETPPTQDAQGRPADGRPQDQVDW
jgi:preprotein translocase SecE subunit